MRHFRLSLTLAVAACLMGAAWPTGFSASPTTQNSSHSSLTNQQLAAARAATAKYHDVAQALADGYVRVTGDIPGEGFHYNKRSLLDCTFDPEQPETLHYALFPNETELRLVGVEYAVPIACGSAPEGFNGDADEWEDEPGGPVVWNVNVWLWLHNPLGMFAPLNPLVP